MCVATCHCGGRHEPPCLLRWPVPVSLCLRWWADLTLALDVPPHARTFARTGAKYFSQLLLLVLDALEAPTAGTRGAAVLTIKTMVTNLPPGQFIDYIDVVMSRLLAW